MSRRRNPTLPASLHPALRAADGAPYFSDDALEEANTEGETYKSRTALVLMDPADFLRIADPGKEEARQVALEQVLREGTRLSDVPRLFVDYDETSGVAVVTGHEGRHRSRSLLARGVKQMPVRIHTTNIRWSEQTSPKAWDYIEVLPHTLTGEAGHAYNRMPMPVPIHYPQLAERMMKKNPTLTLSRYATREEIKAASDRFFDALEARAGEKQTMYAGPFVVVGDRKGGVLGNLEVSVGVSSTLEAREPVVRLSFIGVSPDQRGEGRGTALLNLVTSAADDAGLAVELDVDPQTMHGDKKPPMNKAALRAFYKKAGFATVRGMGSDFMRRPVTKRNPRRMDGSVRPTRATQVNAYLAENGFPGVMLHRSARDAYCHFYGGDTDYWDDTSVYVPRISDLTLDGWLSEAQRLAQTKRNPRRRNPARPARPARPKKFSNDPLTAQEKKDSGIANVYLMDWVCDGWGPLPPRIAEFEARRTPLTNAEKRELIDWYENNCHVNMF